MADEQSLHIANIASQDQPPNLHLDLEVQHGSITATNTDPTLEHEQAVLNALERYNSCVKAYADLLSKLADPSLTGDSDLETNATSLSQDSSKLLSDLKVSLPESGTFSASATGILSTAFTGGLELYLHHRQAAALKDAIKSNQKAIENYSAAGCALVQEALETCSRTYGSGYEPLVDTFTQGVAQRTKNTTLDYKKAWSLATQQERTSYIKSQYAAQQDFKTKSAALSSLYKVFEALPQAHEDLATAIDSPGANFEGLTSLYNESSHLVTIYNSIEKSTK
jgi:hypothetical protein